LWHDVEGRNVPWAHDGEVTAVNGRDLNDAEAFGGSDDGCVGTAKGKVGVLADESRHSPEVGLEETAER
jgi:hypothetical protein